MPGNVEVNLHSEIRESTGNVVWQEDDIVALETQIEFLKTYNVSHIAPGSYVLVQELHYN